MAHNEKDQNIQQNPTPVKRDRVKLITGVLDLMRKKKEGFFSMKRLFSSNESKDARESNAPIKKP
ncbi:MAG: hypothetical protein ACHQJ6_04570 [Candidatus Berkiellales bacterium]